MLIVKILVYVTIMIICWHKSLNHYYYCGPPCIYNMKKTDSGEGSFQLKGRSKLSGDGGINKEIV